MISSAQSRLRWIVGRDIPREIMDGLDWFGISRRTGTDLEHRLVQLAAHVRKEIERAKNE